MGCAGMVLLAPPTDGPRQADVAAHAFAAHARASCPCYTCHVALHVLPIIVLCLQWLHRWPVAESGNHPLCAMQVPFAPPPAASTDPWEMYDRRRPKASAGADAGRRFRVQFVRHLKQRDVDWRDSFSVGVAGHAKAARVKQAAEDEAARQASWRTYKAQLFEQAAAAAPAGSQQSRRAGQAMGLQRSGTGQAPGLER